MRPFVGPLRMEGSRERLFKPCKFSCIVRGVGEWRGSGEGEWKKEQRERGKERERG